jgi:hypothetical protein
MKALLPIFIPSANHFITQVLTYHSLMQPSLPAVESPGGGGPPPPPRQGGRGVGPAPPTLGGWGRRHPRLEGGAGATHARPAPQSRALNYTVAPRGAAGCSETSDARRRRRRASAGPKRPQVPPSAHWRATPSAESRPQICGAGDTGGGRGGGEGGLGDLLASLRASSGMLALP